MHLPFRRRARSIAGIRHPIERSRRLAEHHGPAADPAVVQLDVAFHPKAVAAVDVQASMGGIARRLVCEGECHRRELAGAVGLVDERTCRFECQQSGPVCGRCTVGKRM